MSKRDLLEEEVMRISNPKGRTVEIEDISKEVTTVKILPIPHKEFLGAVSMVGNIIRAGATIAKDIGAVGALIDEAVSSVETESDSKEQTPVSIAEDKPVSMDEFIFRLLNSATGLVEKIITEGTTLKWDVAPEKYHTVVLTNLALQVLKCNYGDELQSLLAQGLGLIPKKKEQDSATTE